MGSNDSRMLVIAMLRRPVVVVFIGPVGSGKTTHMRLACNTLRKMGIRPYCISVKTMFIATRLTIALGLSKLLPGVERVYVTLDLLLNSVLIPLQWLVRTLMLPALMRRRVVLVEEGLFGSVVDYFNVAFVLNLQPVVRRLLGLLFFLFRMGHGDGVVFTLCDLSLLPHRWKERGTPQESPIYIFAQVVVFNIVARALRRNLLQINTALDLGLNKKQVLSYIISLLAQRGDRSSLSLL